MWQYGSGRCTLKTAHRKFSIKRAMQTANDAGDTLRRKVRKRHQISMIRKSFYITVQRLLLLHSRTVIKNSPNSKSKDETWVLTHMPNVLYARKNRRQLLFCEKKPCGASQSCIRESSRAAMQLARKSSSRFAKKKRRYIQRSSEEGRRADALALRADERRDKLR